MSAADVDDCHDLTHLDLDTLRVECCPAWAADPYGHGFRVDFELEAFVIRFTDGSVLVIHGWDDVDQTEPTVIEYFLDEAAVILGHRAWMFDRAPGDDDFVLRDITAPPWA